MSSAGHSYDLDGQQHGKGSGAKTVEDENAELRKQLEAKKAEKDELIISRRAQEKLYQQHLDELKSEKAVLEVKNAELETEKADLVSRNAKLESEKKAVSLNHWNSAECHPELFIDDALLVVGRRERTIGCTWASVRAEMMVPRHCPGIFYFEATIVKKGRWKLMVGLAPQSLKTTSATNFKDFSGCYSYESDGIFGGHQVKGCKYSCNAIPYIDGKPEFGAGDVIGCGVNLSTHQIIYAKNGKRLNTSGLFVSDSDDLYPFVAMKHFADRVAANFGQFAFAYDLTKEPVMLG